MFDINPFCVRDSLNCVRVKIFLLCFMDDKEKEKFGVIIDKDKQPQDEQPKVEESTPVDEKIDNQVENNQTLEQKQINTKVNLNQKIGLEGFI